MPDGESSDFEGVYSADMDMDLGWKKCISDIPKGNYKCTHWYTFQHGNG